MLNTAIQKADLAKSLVSKADFHPFPRYEERARWEALAPDLRAYFLGYGEAMQGCAWPELPARLYMDFVRNGNRARYEKPYFERRTALFGLVIAECVEGKGRFIDDIITGVWAICEESTWLLPAHNNIDRNAVPNPLVDLEEEPLNLDLFSAETGSLLSWVYALLGTRLGQESPVIPRRIEREIDHRVLTPYEKRSDFGWMALSHNHPVNNWNPWINSNVLAAALNIEPAKARRASLLEKIGRSTQRFIDSYAPDGGCDEGPGYFNVAGASLLDILGLYEDATGGKVDIYQQPLIQNMGKFIMYTHIAGNWHVNFADAPARVQPDGMLLWRAGIKTGQEDLVDYACGALAGGFSAPPYGVAHNTVYRRLGNLFQYSAADYERAPLVEASGHYFPGIEVLTARTRENSDEGLFLAIKGGHNGESHNHNDIGNYIIALDGEPLVADAGVGVYTKFTFNEMRYTIWTMQSGYHNTAILNGHDQLPGTEHGAKDVACTESDRGAAFSLEMAGAYGPEAGVSSYRRALTFSRETNTITIEDRVKLAKAETPTALPLLTAVKPEVKAGVLRLPGEKRALLLTFDPAQFEASTEAIALDDANLQKNWERPFLYRTLLTRKAMPLEDAYTVTYSIEK